jgi:DUF4097 and DUF4098 domain-containing protein YvlB
MRRTVSMTFAVALVTLMAATAARADQWSKSYSVSGKPDLTLSADNARVQVIPGAAGRVSVRVTTTGKRIPDDVRVTASQNGNAIKVEVKEAHHFFHITSGSVVVNATVPSQADLDVKTGNGRVSLGAITGNLRAGTGNGRIEVTGAHGGIYLRTGNGRITASGLDGSLDAHTGNGSVHASGRFSALSAESGHGQVEVTVLPGSKMTSGWEVRSGVGNLTVRLPAQFSAVLDGSTGVGRITVDFPVTVSGDLNRSSIHGRIGQGGQTLRVHTGVGSVHIERSSD